MYPLPVMSARQPSASPGMISKDLTDGRISDIEVKAKSYFTALYTNKDSTVLSDNIHVTESMSPTFLPMHSRTSSRKSPSCASQNNPDPARNAKKARPQGRAF